MNRCIVNDRQVWSQTKAASPPLPVSPCSQQDHSRGGRAGAFSPSYVQRGPGRCGRLCSRVRCGVGGRRWPTGGRQRVRRRRGRRRRRRGGRDGGGGGRGEPLAAAGPPPATVARLPAAGAALGACAGTLKKPAGGCFLEVILIQISCRNPKAMTARGGRRPAQPAARAGCRWRTRRTRCWRRSWGGSGGGARHGVCSGTTARATRVGWFGRTDGSRTRGHVLPLSLIRVRVKELK